MHGLSYILIFIAVFIPQSLLLFNISFSTWLFAIVVIINLKKKIIHQGQIVIPIFIVTSFGAFINGLLIFNFLSWMRLLIIFGMVHVSLDLKKNNEKTFSIFIFIVLTTTAFLLLLFLLGVNIYRSPIGERFGFRRPFLFSSPIDISVMLVSISIYYQLQKNNRFLCLFSLVLMLFFQSLTGIFIFFGSRKKFFINALFLLPIIIIFLQIVDISTVGSITIRLEIIRHSLKQFSISPWYIQLFGVGLRGLTQVGESLFDLNINSDMTLFIRMLFESGYTGIILILYFLIKIYQNNKRLARVLFFLALSIDQMFYYWILIFLIPALDTQEKSERVSV